MLKGKRVIVTGASRGLGRAFAIACAAEGAHVLINARDADSLAATQALIRERGGICEMEPGAVGEYAVCERIVQRTVHAFGGVDCLVNNAGITRDRTLRNMSPEEFNEVVAVNLFGTWACGKFAAVAMQESGGSIVNVVSNTAFTGAIGQSNYGASKAGIAGMTRTWTRELARYGIRVNAIWPIASTDMTAGLIERLADTGGRRPTDEEAAALGFGRPDEVADIVVFLASDRARHVSGQVITFNGRKLALWSHPSEVETLSKAQWSPELLAETFEGPLADRLQALYDAF